MLHPISYIKNAPSYGSVLRAFHHSNFPLQERCSSFSPTKPQAMDSPYTARHKLPKATFWVLVGLSGFYVVFALVVVVLASLQTLGDRKNVAEAQVRLSVDGLAAKAFESDAFRAPVTKGSKLFNERRGGSEERVALVQNEVSGMDLVVVDAMRS
jgi:hypothetical protein